ELARFATRATEKKLLSWAKRTSPAGIRARADQELRIPREDVEQAEKWRLLEWEWAEGNTGFSFWGSLPDDEAGLFVTGIERMMERLAVTPEEGGSTREMRRADALVALISASIANDPDPDKATLVVHTTIDGILEGDSNGVLHGGLPIPPEAVALAACDARVQTVLHDENDNIFHVSSPSYVVPKWLRRQVEHRDGYRCTFPNCGRKGFTEVHHIVSWPRGITELSNLTLLCHFHHRLVHIHGWHVQMTEGGLTRWFRPNWTPYQPGASPPPRGYADNQDHHVDQLLAEGSGA
ncbi:MAG TPA: DUF222 domain-containing protein, partial [Actinomycetota bacterium]|nr:DUF222 domain-containing protein [Actinomycetota bacterium]